VTGEVRLREVRESDLPCLFQHQLDPDANHMAAFPARDIDAFTAHWAKVTADDSVTKRTVLFDGRVAGNIVCFTQGGQTPGRLLDWKRVLGQGDRDAGAPCVSRFHRDEPAVRSRREAQQRLDSSLGKMWIHDLR